MGGGEKPRREFLGMRWATRGRLTPGQQLKKKSRFDSLNPRQKITLLAAVLEAFFQLFQASPWGGSGHEPLAVV
jgi:hypothetical protein